MNDKPSSDAPPKRGGNGNRSKSKNEPTAAGQQIAPDAFETGYDLLLVNGTIEERLFADVALTVGKERKNRKVVLCLVTYGGQANAAYRIGRFLQTVYDEIVAFVPSLCKSAGTLIITAAHKVIISPYGEVGPLDVQLSQRDEIIGYRSGLTTRSALQDLRSQAFEFFNDFVIEISRRSQGNISFRLASEIAVKATTGCMCPIFEKINPDAIGQDLRDLNVATEYCNRLNAKSKNLKPGAVAKLVHGYPSHDFVIDLEEARDIFVSADRPTSFLRKVLASRVSDMMVPRTSGALVEMLSKPQPPAVVTASSPASPASERPDEQTEEDSADEDRNRPAS